MIKIDREIKIFPFVLVSSSAWMMRGFVKPKLLKCTFLTACFLPQVYPRATTFTLTTCSLSITNFTITPTIPARRDKNGIWPKISFWLPKEIQLVNNDEQCEIELRKTESVLLEIKTTCPATGVSEGLKAIVPHISGLHFNSVWTTDVGLPTIWVRRQKIKSFKNCKSSTKLIGSLSGLNCVTRTTKTDRSRINLGQLLFQFLAQKKTLFVK